MKYKQTIGKPRREFHLNENHILIKSSPFFGNHTEENYEYSSLTTTVSIAKQRPDSFSYFLLTGFFSLLWGVTYYLDEYQTGIIAPIISGGIFIVMLIMAFTVRKRIPYLGFHNCYGIVLFDIGGNSDEFNKFISELKKRISLAKNQKH